MKYIRKFDSAAALQAAIQAGTIERPFVAWDSTASTTNLEFGEPTEAPTTTTEAPTTTTEAPVTVDYTEPFYIEDISGSSNTVSIGKQNSLAPTLTIQKSTDGVNWSNIGTTSSNISVVIPANGKIYLRCSTEGWAIDSSDESSNSTYHNRINPQGNCNVGGNINSLLYGSSFNGQTEFPNSINGKNRFRRLFWNNTHIVNAENLLLPATILDDLCYMQMFYGCTSLTKAPILPATTLANECYNTMFRGCTSLTKAPILPATTLVNKCYYGMFMDCTILNEITTYANDISAIDCLTNWVYGVTGIGTFHNLGSATYQSGDSGIPSGWTVEDAA